MVAESIFIVLGSHGKYCTACSIHVRREDAEKAWREDWLNRSILEIPL